MEKFAVGFWLPNWRKKIEMVQMINDICYHSLRQYFFMVPSLLQPKLLNMYTFIKYIRSVYFMLISFLKI